jgi:muramidase (phage lysozyme)
MTKKDENKIIFIEAKEKEQEFIDVPPKETAPQLDESLVKKSIIGNNKIARLLEDIKNFLSKTKKDKPKYRRVPLVTSKTTNNTSSNSSTIKNYEREQELKDRDRDRDSIHKEAEKQTSLLEKILNQTIVGDSNGGGNKFNIFGGGGLIGGAGKIIRKLLGKVGWFGAIALATTVADSVRNSVSDYKEHNNIAEGASLTMSQKLGYAVSTTANLLSDAVEFMTFGLVKLWDKEEVYDTVESIRSSAVEAFENFKANFPLIGSALDSFFNGINLLLDKASDTFGKTTEWISDKTEELGEYLFGKHLPQLNKEISELENKDSKTDKEKQKLEELKQERTRKEAEKLKEEARELEEEIEELEKLKEDLKSDSLITRTLAKTKMHMTYSDGEKGLDREIETKKKKSERLNRRSQKTDSKLEETYTDDATKDLLTTIARGEGTTIEKAKKHGYNSEYDVTLGYGKYADDKSKPITSMTIGEVKELQGQMLKRGASSTAVGKYQFISKTLKELQEKNNLSDDTIFSKEVQDKFATDLLKRRGLEKFKEGKISEAQFQKNLSMEWASIAKDDSNQSYYGQHVGTSNSTIEKAIKRVKSEPQQKNQKAKQQTVKAKTSTSPAKQIKSINTAINNIDIQIENKKRQGEDYQSLLEAKEKLEANLSNIKSRSETQEEIKLSNIDSQEKSTILKEQGTKQTGSHKGKVKHYREAEVKSKLIEAKQSNLAVSSKINTVETAKRQRREAEVKSMTPIDQAPHFKEVSDKITSAINNQNTHITTNTDRTIASQRQAVSISGSSTSANTDDPKIVIDLTPKSKNFEI